MSKGCNLCDDKRSCVNWHLYAIELDTKNVFQTPILSINLAMTQLKHIMLGKLLTQLNADIMNTPEGKKVNSNVPVFPMSLN